MKELSNWGRWGKDDAIGTANLITPAKVKQATALAREGMRVSLESDLIRHHGARNIRVSVERISPLAAFQA